ncbi:MAG: sensor histidine kinase [Acidimicrobiales bacterium]
MAIFHVALGGATVVALGGSEFQPLRWIGLLAAVVLVAAARHLAERALIGVGEGSARHLAVGAMWTAVTLPAMVILVNAEGAFFFASYGLFPQAFRMLPRNWAMGFTAALVPAVLLGAQGISELGDSGFVVSVVGSALLGPAIGLFIHTISRQSEQRQEAIVALQAAQAEAECLLQASLAISAARSAEEVAAAVGTGLAGYRVRAVALLSGGQRLATWTPSTPGPPDHEAFTTTTSAGAPGLRSDDELVLEATTAAPLTPASRRTLETLATSCRLALANLRLAEQTRQAGVLEERARLAREIHDTLAQGFISVLTQLEAAADGLWGVPQEVVRRVEQASRIARASLGEARRSVQALRPEPLDGASLTDAIERVVARWADETSVGARVMVTGPAVSLPPPTEVTLLRATQEALANVGRHANATAVTVTLSFLGDAVVLDVDDDGRGFDTAAPPNGSGGGFGLQALEQRVQAAGGIFGLESEPANGTTLTVYIPVPGPTSE